MYDLKYPDLARQLLVKLVPAGRFALFGRMFQIEGGIADGAGSQVERAALDGVGQAVQDRAVAAGHRLMDAVEVLPRFLDEAKDHVHEQRQVPVQNVLGRLKEEDLMKLTTLLEDDRISEEVYLQKLDLMLGVVNDPAYESADIGNEGLEVLKTWEQMDEGDLEFGEGLKEAVDREKTGGQKEAKERETGDAEPA